jgi:hypothetical protein
MTFFGAQDALLISNWPLLMDAASNCIGPAADWFFYAFKLLTFYYIQVTQRHHQLFSDTATALRATTAIA